MSITSSHIKEQMQKAYVSAVVGRAGAACNIPQPDYGHDLVIQEVRKLPSGKLQAQTTLFFCQLKATTTAQLNDTDLIYDMDAGDYNSFLESGDGLRILVVFHMPKNDKEWVNISDDSLLLKHCCYWQELSGQPKSNSSKVRLKIPRTQKFTPDAVIHLLQYSRKRASNGS